jgi:type II restriction enzyme
MTSDTNPNLYVLQYRRSDLFVENFFAVPRYFFAPGIIEKRPPLAVTARRAGWVGCNILIGLVPNAGRIHYVRNGEVVDKRSVLQAWNSVRFLGKQKSPDARGWLLDVMKCIDEIGTCQFSLDDIYRFQPVLKAKYPLNNFIREKIRQQLQVLRDNGYLEFVSRGKYRVIIS